MSASANAADQPGTLANPGLIATLRWPRCGGSLSAVGAAPKCQGCARTYPLSDGGLYIKIGRKQGPAAG